MENNLRALSFKNLDSNENIKDSINDLNELYKNKELTYKEELEKANKKIQCLNFDNKNLLEENNKMKKKVKKYKNLIKDYKNSTKDMTENFYNKMNSEKNELLEKIAICRFENKKLKEEKINLEEKLDKFFKKFSLFFRDNINQKKKKLFNISKNSNFNNKKINLKNNDMITNENFNSFINSSKESVKFIDKSIEEKINIFKNSDKNINLIINSEIK